MEFDPQFFEEEIRYDYVVSTTMKKVWAVELNILEEIDRICKKYQITYYAAYGTLLGAIRHQGFIPWDDDLDIVMMRPDYERFRQIAKRELHENYELQEELSPYLNRSFYKVRDGGTTAIEFPGFPEEYNQGIFVDIFPLDDGCDSPAEITPEFVMKKEMWAALVNPGEILAKLSANGNFLLPQDILRFIATDRTGKGLQIFGEFCSTHFGTSKKIDMLVRESECPGGGQKREWYDKVCYLPFENFMIPVPREYEKCLIHRFGKDYMIPIKFASLHNGVRMDPEKTYREYL